jgi:hypothetical protein
VRHKTRGQRGELSVERDQLGLLRDDIRPHCPQDPCEESLDAVPVSSRCRLPARACVIAARPLVPLRTGAVSRVPRQPKFHRCQCRLQLGLLLPPGGRAVGVCTAEPGCCRADECGSEIWFAFFSGGAGGTAVTSWSGWASGQLLSQTGSRRSAGTGNRWGAMSPRVGSEMGSRLAAIPP